MFGQVKKILIEEEMFELSFKSWYHLEARKGRAREVGICR
jgi:hypothetical protein